MPAATTKTDLIAVTDKEYKKTGKSDRIHR